MKEAINYLHYTKVDINDKLTVSASQAGGALDLDADAYLYKDFGVGHFETAVVEAKMWFTDGGSQAGAFIGLGFSNDIDDAYHWGSERILVKFQVWTNRYLKLSNGSAEDITAALPNSCYWVRLTLNGGGSNATLQIYSNEAMTSLVDTLTIAQPENEKYRYFYPFSNMGYYVADKDYTIYTADVELDDQNPPSVGAGAIWM